MPGFASLSLRVGLVAGVLVVAGASGPLAQQRVGVSGAVNPEAISKPPGAAARRLVIGQEIVFNERITTQASGQTQLLFLDESTMTIGPNSDITIDQFVYDPKSGTGKLAMSATRGLLRYVGGKLSKEEDAVTLRTSTATLAVRGGAFMAKIDRDGTTDAVFIYGKGLTISGTAGGFQILTRPGYSSTTKAGGAPSSPAPAPAGQLAALTQQLDGRAGASGGATTVPTDAAVVSSGVSGTISGSFSASVQQAQQNRVGTQFALQGAVNTGSATNSQLNSAGQIIDCSSAGVCNTAAQVGTTTSGQPVGGPNSVSIATVVTPAPTPTPIPTPTPVSVTYAGRLKNTNGNGTARGFVDQTANGDIAYSSGTLSFPPGAPQSGVFTAKVGNLGTISFPLVPGSASFGPQGTSSSLGTFSGTSFLAADNTFFYVTLTPTSQPSERLFISGGMPVNPSFYQSTGNTRIFAFSVQPDSALQSNIPFIRSQAGGNLPNASVSPLYVVAPPTTPIGDATTASGARALQASLAINGQGADQQSTIAVATGTIAAQQSNGQPILSGQLRGSSLQSAGGTPVRLGSAVSSTVDGAGNSLYGANAISGFVVDQTAFSNGTNGSVGNPIIPSSASEIPLSGTGTTYGFAQPALPTAVPSGVGASRTTQTLNGNFGGLMYTAAQPTPYIVTGSTSIATDAANNRIQATLNGSAQSPSAGVSTVVMQYGGLTGTPGGQAFVDDSTFAAAESQVNPQQIVVNGVASQPTGQLYLASSGAAGAPASLLPSGVSYCQCQYLQWGYWGGDLNSPNITPNANGSRIDRGHINTWVAGVGTPLNDMNTLISQSATGTYSGHAIGSVYNNGASYVAVGGFTDTYNFGTQMGTASINNFDGHSFTATGKAPLTGNTYSFSVTSPGAKGSISGAFYGPMAAETGGNFAVQTTVGPSYLASGIFAGKK
jgi:hypothetical protein